MDFMPEAEEEEVPVVTEQETVFEPAEVVQEENQEDALTYVFLFFWMEKFILHMLY